MKTGRWVLAALALGVLPFSAWGQTMSPSAAVGPTNQAVLLPPENPDDTIKIPGPSHEHYGEWSITGGVMFLEPVFETNPAFTVASPGGNSTRQVDFSQHFEASPDIWLGYTSERGWGFRVRYFEFDSDASEGYSAAPGETIRGVSFLPLGQAPLTGTAQAMSHLRVTVVDAQGTCTWESAFWQHVVGFGLRYTSMSQDYQASIGSPAAQVGLASSHDFSGVGPSISFETKRRLGETGFAIYGQAYGSILFGDENDNYTAVSGGVTQAYTHSLTEVMPVAELEIGLEYEHSWGRAKAFLQAGFNGQIWWNGGNASNLDAPGISAPGRSNFGFVGAAVRAGLRY